MFFEGMKRIGIEVERREEVASTNDWAKEEGKKGAPEGKVFVAEVQTAGRGRWGRRWHSPRGGIWMSILLRPPDEARPFLSFVAALSSAEALRKVTGIDARTKWPNDVVVRGKKIGGILVEAERDFVVVGIGLNVNLREGDFPPELLEVATSVWMERGEPVDREELLAELMEQVERRYNLLLAEGAEPILAEWRAMDVCLGRKVKVEVGSRVVEGMAEEVTGEGALRIRREDGGVEEIFSGTVLRVGP